MSQLTHLSRRIKSVTTTKKITQAMRLIAMSLYSRLEKEGVAIQIYHQQVNAAFEKYRRAVPRWCHPIVAPFDSLDARPVYVIFSAIKGLCGSFHDNLERYIERVHSVDAHQEPHYYAVGTRAIRMIEQIIRQSGRGVLIGRYTDVSTQTLLPLAKTIAQVLWEANPTYSSITVYSNHFQSFFIQKPQKTLVVQAHVRPARGFPHRPATQEPEVAIDTEEVDIHWEQPTDVILDRLAQTYLVSSIARLLVDSLVAEQAARFMAMDGATTNAERYLERLLLQFNKIRQALITKEVAELSAGLE